MPETERPTGHGLKFLRRIPMRIILVRCYDWWNETHCWRHSREYRAWCRKNPDVCMWEVEYVRDVSRRCVMVH